MRPKHKRLTVILLALGALGLATALILNAMESSLVFFIGPTEASERDIAPGRAFRLGGLVEIGSVAQQADGLTTRFRVTDGAAAVPVVYRGLLPDLFREGQGVVAEGAFSETGEFRATKVLAKHDENYMPPEVAEALKKSGRWQGEGEGAE